MGSGRLALQGDRRSRPPLPEPGAEGTGSPTALSAGGDGDASGCGPRFHAEAVVDPREARRRLRARDERGRGYVRRLRRAGLQAAVTLGVVVHRHGSRTVREERPRAPGFEAVNMRDFDRKGRGARGHRKGWKRRLAPAISGGGFATNRDTRNRSADPPGGPGRPAWTRTRRREPWTSERSGPASRRGAAASSGRRGPRRASSYRPPGRCPSCRPRRYGARREARAA